MFVYFIRIMICYLQLLSVPQTFSFIGVRCTFGSVFSSSTKPIYWNDAIKSSNTSSEIMTASRNKKKTKRICEIRKVVAVHSAHFTFLARAFPWISKRKIEKKITDYNSHEPPRICASNASDHSFFFYNFSFFAFYFMMKLVSSVYI